MGYRDDRTALESLVEVLATEVAEVEGALERARREGAELRRAMAKKRVRLLVRRVGRWFVGHPKTTFVLIAIAAVAGLVGLQHCQEARQIQERIESALGKGCSTLLKVDASFGGARVFVNDLELGAVPQRTRICAGTYLLRVIHDKALPYHDHVTVSGQEEIPVRVNLVPWRPEDRPPGGTLIFSQPAGALVFIGGREMGRTPLFLRRWPGGATPPVPVALWARGYRTHVWTLGPHPLLWLHMDREPVKKGAP